MLMIVISQIPLSFKFTLDTKNSSFFYSFKLLFMKYSMEQAHKYSNDARLDSFKCKRAINDELESSMARVGMMNIMWDGKGLQKEAHQSCSVEILSIEASSFLTSEFWPLTPHSCEQFSIICENNVSMSSALFYPSPVEKRNICIFNGGLGDECMSCCRDWMRALANDSWNCREC